MKISAHDGQGLVVECFPDGINLEDGKVNGGTWNCTHEVDKPQTFKGKETERHRVTAKTTQMATGYRLSAIPWFPGPDSFVPFRLPKAYKQTQGTYDLLSFLLAGILSLSVVDVRVETTDGQTHTGPLHKLTGEGLFIADGDSLMDFSLKNVLAISPVNAIPATIGQSEFELGLVDGTRLRPQSFRVDRDRVICTYTDQESVTTFARNSVHYVRWLDLVRTADRESLSRIQSKWQEFLAVSPAHDRLVIRRKRRNKMSLRALPGIIHDVRDQKVGFEYNGSRVEVAIPDKVEGLIYYQPGSLPAYEATCIVYDRRGSQLSSRTIVSLDDTLRVTLTAGNQVDLDWSQIEKIDFTGDKILFLSDTEPEAIRWTPFLSPSKSSLLLEQFHAPRRDQGFDGRPLTLSRQGKAESFAKGLAIRSRTELVYLLDRQYRRFKAFAGIAPAVGQQGHIHLVFWGDGQQLLETQIKGGGEPLEIDIDITDVRRLKILVDFGDHLDLADYLHLCDAKVVK